ncbi:MAG: 3-methyl-2-oxobutanoate hydroxymethyltransferase [Nitrospinae bacterium]|nr:3-methyl-2-oxobutanoate hydroxymethyltransferase [Nitrospinota bacterium]MBF0633442.1 3-methyl-2-oxobutanoate hydroxymethyltransferase [Nitrospinota bacterium]
MSEEKVTITRLKGMKAKGEKITALTAYDYVFARLADSAGADIVLVGDSLGMTFRGEENTLKVTVDDMAYHTRAVRRGLKRALLVTDMPFLSCHSGIEKTVENVGRLVSEGAEAVKIEGGRDMAGTVEHLVRAGIPVMGHIGLTPQSIHQLGGFKIQGKGGEGAKLKDAAKAIAEAGAFAIVLECVPAPLAEEITRESPIPIIGIGAGPKCDGQILVTNDVLGLTPGASPKFVKKYADLSRLMVEAMGEYVAETKSGAFPGEEHSYHEKTRHLKAI